MKLCKVNFGSDEELKFINGDNGDMFTKRTFDQFILSELALSVASKKKKISDINLYNSIAEELENMTNSDESFKIPQSDFNEIVKELEQKRDGVPPLWLKYGRNLLKQLENPELVDA